MLKKTLGIALLMASLSSTAFAAIPKDSMHIGGLKPGMTIEQVAAMYGQPVDAKSQFKAQQGMYYIAGGIIKGWLATNVTGKSLGYFSDYAIGGYNMPPEAKNVEVTAGIRLGMTSDEVISRLGKPDYTMTMQNGKVWTHFYFSTEPVTPGTGREHDTFFFTFADGILNEISINYYAG